MLTLTEYINSINKLRDGLNKEPIAIFEYRMKKYCKISIGKSVNIRDMFILKPGDIIKVKWIFSKDDMVCSKMIIDDISYDVYWKNEKIKKWIEKNTEKM